MPLTAFLLVLLMTTSATAIAEDRSSAPAVHAEVNQGTTAATIHTELTQRVPAGFGGAIIVERDGNVILKSGYGWADRERHIAFTPSTIAQVGSLTKQFTATAVVDLALQGKLTLSDPVSTYLKDVPAKASSITIHQLLTHTAGLPDDCGDDFDLVSREDLTQRCLAGMDVSPPGKFSYSNFGYSLLAAVVETVSGQSLEMYLAVRFFQPLHMARTGYFFSPSLHDRLACGYDNDTLQAPMSDRLQTLRPDFWNLKGNGGMQASVEDMYAWYRALSSSSVVPDTLRNMLTTPYVERDDGAKYGYGWFLRTDENGTVEQISHTGSDGVFFSAFVWRPIDRVFYYLVTNSGEKAGAEEASTVLRTLRNSLPSSKK